MYRLLTISCYFGKLPEHFPEFLRSVEMNPTIDFLLVTDCEIDNPPSNVQVYNCSFEEIKERFQSEFDFQIVLDRPYKLCDFRPAWGVVFREYIKDYDFWGHCDMDMIFGDIRAFLPDEVLSRYDKIYKLGHLAYYRNTKENNHRYQLDGGVCYKAAFTTSEGVAFDEIAGIYNIFQKHQFPLYFSRDYADITYGKVRFTLSYFHVPEELVETNNYDKQVFYWEDGHVYRAYLKNGEILREEFNYIHFSKRRMTRNDLPKDCRSFFITNKGLFAKQGPVQEEDFERFNKYEYIPEFLRTVECRVKRKKEQYLYYLKILLKVWK